MINFSKLSSVQKVFIRFMQNWADYGGIPNFESGQFYFNVKLNFSMPPNITKQRDSIDRFARKTNLIKKLAKRG